MISAQSLIDFTFCIGLLSTLAACYGAIRRRLPGTVLAPQFLGLCFGAAAVLMMHLPIRPFEGVIVDLRVIPIVLAGAFLGLRGMVIAVLLATAMRVWIGGIGWFSGVMSIWTAAAIGLVWAYATSGSEKRSARSLLALGAGACLTTTASLALPANIAWWFLGTAAPLLALCYLTIIPALALLLERQRVAMQREAWEREEMRGRNPAEFDGPEALILTLAQAQAAGRFRSGTDVLALRVRSGRLALSLWGADVEVAVLAALRARMNALLPRGAEAGIVSNGAILIFLEPETGVSAQTMLHRLCTGLAAEPFDIPGMAPVRLRLDGRTFSFAGLPSWRDIAAAFDAAAPPEIRRASPPQEGVARLLHITERLFEACAAERGLSGMTRDR